MMRIVQKCVAAVAPIARTMGAAGVWVGVGACTTYLAPQGWSPSAVAGPSRLKAREGLVPRVAAQGLVSAEAGLASGQAHAVVLAERPGRLRVEVLTPTDDLVAIVTANAERLVYWERGSDVCYAGPPCPEHVGRFLGLALDPRDVVALLLGAPPIPVGPVRSSWDPSMGAEELEWGAPPSEMSAWLDVRTGAPLAWDLHRADRRAVRVVWGDWRVVDDMPMPHRVDISLVEQAAQVVWSLDVVDRSLEGGDEAYAFTCPAGVRVEVLPACEQPRR